MEQLNIQEREITSQNQSGHLIEWAGYINDSKNEKARDVFQKTSVNLRENQAGTSKSSNNLTMSELNGIVNILKFLTKSKNMAIMMVQLCHHLGT